MLNEHLWNNNETDYKISLKGTKQKDRKKLLFWKKLAKLNRY
jgi:hypothetical protein